MSARQPLVAFVTCALLVLAAGYAWALGEGLAESKEELKLDYEVSVMDQGGARVTVKLTIADAGRLKPLTSVNLLIPSQAGEEGGGGLADLSLALAVEKVDGKQVARVHLLRESAERAEILLSTSTLDGKQASSRTWYYHAIPLAPHIKNGRQEGE